MDAVASLSDAESLLSPLMWKTSVANVIEELSIGRTSTHPSSHSKNHSHGMFRVICHSRWASNIMLHKAPSHQEVTASSIQEDCDIDQV